MTYQLILYTFGNTELAVVVVVLPVSGKRLLKCESQKEEVTHNFIPDRRIITFRLLGKPSLAQSPPWQIICNTGALVSHSNNRTLLALNFKKHLKQL